MIADDTRAAAADWFARMRGPESEASRPAFELWLAKDPHHAAAYRELETLWDQSKFLQHSRGVRSRDLSSVAVWHRRPATRRAVAAGFGLFILAAGGFGISRIPPATAPVSTIAYSTRTGEVRTIALEDGSTVTLDAGSTIKVSISAAAREVRMIDGTARFDVKPDPARSFAVLTTVGSVTTAAGLFDINQTPVRLRISALRGVLSFRQTNVLPGTKIPDFIKFGPGKRIEVAGVSPAIAVAATPLAQDWTSGMLSFDGERLGDAIAEMNRHNARKIAVADVALADLKITGGFHADDPVGFARTVAAMLGLAVNEDAGGKLTMARKK